MTVGRSARLTAGGLLRACAARLPAELVPPGALKAAMRVADLVPASLADRLGLEVHLGAAAGAVDFGLWSDPAADRDTSGAPSLVREVLRRLAADPPAWAWFEWDGGDPASGFAGASFAAPPDADGAVRTLARLAGRPPDAALAAGRPQGVTSAAGHEREDASVAMIRRLAETGALGSLAAVESRPGRPVAALLSGLELIEAERLLGDLGVSVDRAELRWAWALRARVDLALVLTEHVHPRVGLELLVPPSRREAWAPLLEALGERGVLSGEQAEALLGWIGVTRAGDAGERWPAPLAAAEALAGGRRRAALVRFLSHVKLSVGGGEPPALKAYPCAELRWTG